MKIQALEKIFQVGKIVSETWCWRKFSNLEKWYLKFGVRENFTSRENRSEIWGQRKFVNLKSSRCKKSGVQKKISNL